MFACEVNTLEKLRWSSDSEATRLRWGVRPEMVPRSILPLSGDWAVQAPQRRLLLMTSVANPSLFINRAIEPDLMHNFVFYGKFWEFRLCAFRALHESISPAGISP